MIGPLGPFGQLGQVGHLGHRVSALLDGQLSPVEAERAWTHVHTCHLCRDLVEREGWVKTRLSGLSHGLGGAPDHLKGSLRSAAPLPTLGHQDDRDLDQHRADRSRRVAVVLLGSSAAGVAVLGVLALGTGGTAPTQERQAPVTNLGGVDTSRQVPGRVPGHRLREAAPTPR